MSETTTWATGSFDPQPAPNVHIQWKGTEACLDFRCSCRCTGWQATWTIRASLKRRMALRAAPVLGASPSNTGAVAYLGSRSQLPRGQPGPRRLS